MLTFVSIGGTETELHITLRPTTGWETELATILATIGADPDRVERDCRDFTAVRNATWSCDYGPITFVRDTRAHLLTFTLGLDTRAPVLAAFEGKHRMPEYRNRLVKRHNEQDG